MEKGIKVTLCDQHTWCPVIEYDGEKVYISDDDGNKIWMLPENWNSLVEKIKDGTLGIIS